MSVISLFFLFFSFSFYLFFFLFSFFPLSLLIIPFFPAWAGPLPRLLLALLPSATASGSHHHPRRHAAPTSGLLHGSASRSCAGACCLRLGPPPQAHTCGRLVLHLELAPAASSSSVLVSCRLPLPPPPPPRSHAGGRLLLRLGLAPVADTFASGSPPAASARAAGLHSRHPEVKKASEAEELCGAGRSHVF
jgi:hypothetical protein